MLMAGAPRAGGALPPPPPPPPPPAPRAAARGGAARGGGVARQRDEDRPPAERARRPGGLQPSQRGRAERVAHGGHGDRERTGERSGQGATLPAGAGRRQPRRMP